MVMMKVEVRFYAQCREIVGAGDAMLALPEKATLRDLAAVLQDRYPELSKYWKYLVLAVNEEIARDNRPLCDGDTVALLPPVAGG